MMGDNYKPCVKIEMDKIINLSFSLFIIFYYFHLLAVLFPFTFAHSLYFLPRTTLFLVKPWNYLQIVINKPW